jgi:hypothetical protein
MTQDTLAILLIFAALSGVIYAACGLVIAAKRELLVCYRCWKINRDQRAWDSRPPGVLNNRRVDKEHRSTGRVSRGKVIW